MYPIKTTTSLLLKLGFLRWRAYPSQLFVFVLALGCLTALLALGIQFYSLIDRDRPSFVDDKRHFATVVRADLSNQVKPISAFEIEKFEGAMGINQVGSIGLITSEIKLNRTSTPKIEIGFIDTHVAQMLELSEAFSALNGSTNKAYVSHRFFEKYIQTQTKLKSSVIYIEENSVPYEIAGVLPKQFDKWQSKDFDIWFSKSEMAHFAPFRLSQSEKTNPHRVRENNLYTKRYLRSKSSYFGILELDGTQSLDELMESYLASNLDSSGLVEWQEEQHRTIISRGIQFDPILHHSFVKQWKAVSFLASMLFIIIVSSILFTQTTFLLERKEELITKSALGASKSNFFYESLSESLPIVLISQIIGMVFYYLIISYLSSIDIFVAAFGEEMLKLELVTVIISLVSISIFVSVAYFLPYISHFSQKSLINAKNASLSKHQQWISNGNVLIQIFMSVAILFFTILMLASQVDRFTSNKLSLDVHEYLVTGDGYLAYDNKVKQGSFLNLDSTTTSVSFERFIRPVSTIRVASFVNLDREKDAKSMHVGPTYFRLLDAKFIHGREIDVSSNDQVIINKYLAEHFANAEGKSDLSELIGTNIQKTSMSKKSDLKIVGIVENIPHFGLDNLNQAIVYQQFSELPKFYQYGFFVLVKASESSDFEARLEAELESSLGMIDVVSMGSLDETLFSYEFFRNSTYIAGTFLSILLIALLVFNLSHIVRLKIHSEKTTFGVQLALGSSVKDIYKKICFDYGLLVIIVAPIVIGTCLLLSDFLMSNLFINIDRIDLFLLSLLLAFFFLCFASGLVIFRVARISIARLLEN
jgi:hypothetical protein